MVKKKKKTIGMWPITETQLLAVYIEWDKNGPPMRIDEKVWRTLSVEKRGAAYVSAVFQLRDELFPYQGTGRGPKRKTSRTH